MQARPGDLVDDGLGPGFVISVDATRATIVWSPHGAHARMIERIRLTWLRDVELAYSDFCKERERT